MRLLQMTIENFRIFYGKHTFSFKDKQLIILRGLNGHGKSSFFDAIEWCLTGEIQRYVGSAERQKFHYIVHQSLFSPSFEAIHLDPQANVELRIEKSENDYFTIKRLYRAGKTVLKPIVIDNKAYGIREGNTKIRELLLDTLLEDTEENKKELLKTELPVLLSSTQFLSQDQLQAFVSAKKPQDRYALLEKVLGVQKYGSEFQQYLKVMKEVIVGKWDSSSEVIRTISENLKIKKSVFETTQDILNNVGDENEESLLNKIKTLLNDINDSGILGIPQIHLDSISESAQIKIREHRKQLQEINDTIESNYRLLQESESFFSISEIDYKSNVERITNDILTLNGKLSEYDLKRQRVVNVKNEFESLKKLKRRFQDAKSMLNTINENIEEKSDAQNQLLNDVDLLRALQVHTNVVEFKNEYSNRIIKGNDINEYLKLLDKEKLIALNIYTLHKLNERINLENRNLEQKNEDVNKVKEKRKQIEKMTKDQETNTVAQMIHSVQTHLILKEDHTSCPICGSSFLESSALHEAIKVQLEDANKKLNKSEIELREINTVLGIVESEQVSISEIISELISERNKLIELIKTDEIGAKSDRAKISMDVQNINEEEAKLEVTKVNDYLKLYESAYTVYLALNKLEEEISPLNVQKELYLKTIQDLREMASYRVRWLELSDMSFEHRIRRLDTYMLRLNDADNRISLERAQLNIMLRELETLFNQREIKLKEILEIFPEFLVENRENEIEKLLKLSNRLKVWDSELANHLLKIESFLTRNSVTLLKSELSLISIDLAKQEDKRKYYEELLIQLKNLDENHGKIKSELMNEYLQRYSDKIDDLFMQISPHAFFRHVHLVPKDGELYLVVSDKKEHNLSLLSSEELEKRFNASLTFSSAQSNVLAICIFLALGLAQEWTPLQTIGIDDPFQNLDDINIFSFLDVLSQILMKKQVIISTHDDKFANLVRFKSGLESQHITEIWLESYSKESISIQSDCLIEN